MDFRFQEPDTDVEPLIYQVTATLEGVKVYYYVNHDHGYWQVSNTSAMSYVVERDGRLEAALDKARERACRDVKAALLDQAARRIRQG